MHTFTADDLLLYIYNETSEETTAAINAALESDYNLRESLNELKSSINMLDDLPMQSPRQQTIDAIMQYADKSIGELTQ